MFRKIITIIVSIGLVMALAGLVLSSVEIKSESVLDKALKETNKAIEGVKDKTGGFIQRHTTPPVVVDWGDGLIKAVGRGTLPADAISYPQAKLMAIGAAELDAQRILASTLRGLKVNSKRVTNRYALESYSVEENINAALRGAKIVRTTFLPDGNVEVEMEIQLKVKPKKKVEIDNPTKYNGNESQISYYYNPEERYAPTQDKYTSVIVDVRGLGFHKSRHLKIMNTDGALVFPNSNNDKIPAFTYVREEAKLISDGIAGERPLKIKAAGVSGANKTEIVMNQSDIEFVTNLGEFVDIVKAEKLFVLID